MSYEFYKLLHVVSVLVLFSSLGVLVAMYSNRVDGGMLRAAKIAHGVTLAVIFVAGFGLMARLGMFGAIPVWAWAKIGLWLGLGLIVIPMKRQPSGNAKWWVVASLLGGAAVWFAVHKPF